MRRILHLPFARSHRLSWMVAAVACGAPLLPAARADDPTPAPATSPAATPAATPRPSTEAVKKELTDTIDAQLAAFRANDYPKAYGFAATEIKDMFPVGDFEKMVRGAYPVIAHSSAADYGLAFDTGEEAVVNVRISNAENKSAEYQYLLKKEDGHWKIGGVSELKPQGLSV